MLQVYPDSEGRIVTLKQAYLAKNRKVGISAKADPGIHRQHGRNTAFNFSLVLSATEIVNYPVMRCEAGHFVN